jgi:hypothetical protein
MCCGRNRTALSLVTASHRDASPVQHTRSAAGSQHFVAYFEYVGRTAITVIGPVSGIRYRFAAPGSRLAVDLRDRRALAGVPHLRQIQSA